MNERDLHLDRMREAILKLEVTHYAKEEALLAKRDLREYLQLEVRSLQNEISQERKKLVRWLIIAITLLVGSDIWAFQSFIKKLETSIQDVLRVEVEKNRRTASEVLAKETQRIQGQIQDRLNREFETTRLQQLIATEARRYTANEARAYIAEQVGAELRTPESRKLIGDGIRRELTARMAGRVLTEVQRKTIAESLRSRPEGKVTVFAGALGEQQAYASKIYLAIRDAPSWTAHASYVVAGSWAGMTKSGIFFEGIAIVVADATRPPNSARMLETALKNAGVASVRIQSCGCDDFSREPTDILLYVGEKNY